MFTEGQEPEENEENTGGEEFLTGSDHDVLPDEHWIQTHERWRQREEEESSRNFKKYSPIFAAGVLALGGWEYKHFRDTQKAVELTRQEIQYAPQNYVTYAASRSGLSTEGQSNLRQKLDQLQVVLPEREIVDLQRRAEQVERLRPKVPSQPDITGFEVIGVEKEDLEPVFDKKFFPAGFLHGNVSQIKYKDNTEGVGWTLVGAVAETDEKNGNFITFYRPSLALFNDKNINQNTLRGNIWPTLMHELGHESDWLRRISFSPEERVEFLFEAQNVYKDHRKYKTPLEDMISPEEMGEATMRQENNKDKKALFNATVREWWAELCAGYLEFPNAFVTLASAEEQRLVQKWLLKDDPKFNNRRAYADRHRVWGKAKDTIYKKLVEKGLDTDAGFRKK